MVFTKIHLSLVHKKALRRYTMTSIEFISSNKGKPLLVLDSYVYQLNKSTIKKKYWKCEVKYCTATVHTDANDQFLKKGDQQQLIHIQAGERNRKNYCHRTTA